MGLRSGNSLTNARQKELGITALKPDEVAKNSNLILQWLKSTGASKVLIHFDLDVLDPKELIAAVGTDPEGLKVDEVLRIIKDISVEYDIVGLTVAEHMPRVEIQIQNILNQLPLLQN